MTHSDTLRSVAHALQNAPILESAKLQVATVLWVAEQLEGGESCRADCHDAMLFLQQQMEDSKNDGTYSLHLDHDEYCKLYSILERHTFSPR